MKKELRVRKNEDFSKIIAKKNSLSNQCFIIYKSQNTIDHGRVGLSVSKKLGNAVVRNKIKRQVRMMVQEVFDFNQSYDYIIIVRKNFLKYDYHKNLLELTYLYSKIEKRTVGKNGIRQQN